MAHSSAKPKTPKFELNKFKLADSETQIILHQNKNRENDVVSQLIDQPNHAFHVPRLARGDSPAPGP